MLVENRDFFHTPPALYALLRGGSCRSNIISFKPEWWKVWQYV